MALLARYACQTDVDVFLARIIAIFIYTVEMLIMHNA
jgi:hypothetical protein